MPNLLRPTVLALILAASAFGLAACGDDDPDPSIPREEGDTLLASIEEIEANVDVGSCLVARDRTESLIAEIEDLPDSVDEDVRSALENGANNLELLLADPDQCEPRTTTTEPTTTEEETTVEEPTTTREQDTTREQTTTRETPTQTQTQTTPTTPSGGVEPGASGGL